MLKVLIVDDEIIVRIGLMSCIKWEDYGYQVVGACESAEDAIAAMEKSKPDVVFTDIKMPGMDGLELVEYLRTQYPHIRIIVLSCLNDIESVKSAIKMGAEDYILKLSLTPETLGEVLQKMKKTIELAKETIETGAKSDRENSFERERSYRMLFSEGTFPEQREKLLEKLGYSKEREGRYLACCCLVDDCENAARHNGLSDAYLMKFALLNVMHEFLGKYPFAEAVSIDENESLIIIRFPPQTDIMSEMKAYTLRLNEALKTHLNLSVSVGVSDCFTDYRLLPERYEKSRFLASLRFFYGNQSFITESTAKKAGSKTPSKNLPKALQAAVDELDQTAALDCIGRWFAEIKTERSFLLAQAVKSAVIETWIYISGYSILNTEEPVNEAIKEDDYFLSFWNAETIDVLQKKLEDAVISLIEVIFENRNSHPAIVQFKRYLSENISQTISLAEAASYCCLSKSYFCTLFKKETGENFVDYFSRIKMERARQLLCAENIKVYEAANSVGITDMSYFNKLFRKYFHTSPSQIKKACKPENDTTKS